MGVSATYKSLGQLNGSLTSGNATEALKVIDKAIDDVTVMRGKLGAFQANTLETNISSLKIASENLTAAESSIRDVDFAEESAQFTKNNILVQSATAMLAQANQLPNNVLKLLG
jgi:flagellin